MKKLSIFAIAALAMISCGNTYTAKQVTLTNMNDSVNFALGLVNGANIKMYQLRNDSSDETVTEFIDALIRGYEGKVAELSEAATIGRNIGSAVKASEKKGLAENEAWTMNEKILFQGLINGINNDTIVMDVVVARDFFQTAYRDSRMDTISKAGKTIRAKCGNKAKVITLKDKIDSLNYAFGLLQGSEIKMYVLNNDSDGTMLQELIDGINAGLKTNVRNPQLVRTGEQIGQTIKEQETEGLFGEPSLVTDFELIKQGFICGLYHYYDQFTAETASEYIQGVFNALRYGAAQEEGKKFLAENALKEGVITTESGLQYEVIKMGKGAKPKADSRVKVHYTGSLIDGTVFDSSVDRGEPIVFGLNQVIQGWTEGVQLMPVGSKFRFYIPYELGYGESGSGGSIPPYATLIFDVELLGIEK